MTGCWLLVPLSEIQTNVCAWLSEKRETTISPLQEQKTRLTSSRVLLYKMLFI